MALIHYVYKFQSSRFDKNLCINTTFEKSLKKLEVVSIADSQLVRSIKQSIFYTGQHIGSNKVFIPELVNVVVETDKIYDKIAINGIHVNGIKYRRFMCPTSQGRKRTIICIKDSCFDYFHTKFLNGANLQRGSINPSKFNAYFGLSSSSSAIVANFNGLFPDGITFSGVTNSFMIGCRKYNQRFSDSVTFKNMTAGFMNICSAYNQPFPESITFENATTNFMPSCIAYNQPFPESATFENATTYFLQGCSAYDQPFPESATFENATTHFLNNCIAYNQEFSTSVNFDNITTNFLYGCYLYDKPFPKHCFFPKATINFLNGCNALCQDVTVDFSGKTSVGIGFIGGGCFGLIGLHMLNMTSTQTSLIISNTSMQRKALLQLFEDLYDRTGLSAGKLAIYGNLGLKDLTTEDNLIATSKNWILTVE